MEIILSITLLENISFKDIVNKMEKVFDISFICEYKHGRLIAFGDTNQYSIELIDKEDTLGEFLCSENYILEIYISNNENFEYEFYESEIKLLLKKENIMWVKGIWIDERNDDFLNENHKRIYPDY